MINRYSVISRIFVFLAVSVTVVAVAVTSREPLLMAVGIPGLAAGHLYSWHKRDKVSKFRTLLLLLLMVLLTVYLGEEMLLSGITDRLQLSRYLIYGLVLSSFDFLKRRNVLASLVLGGLLLVLISELALSLGFLVFPVLFTVLALVAVSVGRIEAEANQAVVVGKLSWLTAGRVWLSLAVGTMLLSAVFFLLMPRLTSSEIAQASWLPSRLDLSLSGSALLPSKPSASVSPGILPFRQAPGDGKYVTLGYTGSLADRAVLYVRSRVSSYWRGAVLDEYDGRGWLPSSPQIELLDESRREYILTDSRVNMYGRKVYWQAYYVLSDQPNAIFIGYNPGRIYLPEEGQVMLERGTLYRALSLMPNFRPERLRSDSVVSTDIANLTLPPISERVAVLAESIVEGSATDYDKAVRLERFLLANYPYDLNVGPLPAGYDAVDYFLFEQQAGYCAYFATAMAVMARQVGLPARVAVGYLPGFIDPMTGAHVVRAGDAHAWVEIHFRQHGWVAFDPTPRADAAMGFATGRNLVYFGLEGFTGVTFASMLTPLAGAFSFGQFSVFSRVGVILFGVVITIIVLLWLRSRRRVKIKQRVEVYSVLDGESRRLVLSLYGRMVALLVRKGLPPRHPSQSPNEYAATIYPHISGGREIIEWLSQVASRAAYDPRPFQLLTVQEVKSKLSALKQVIARLSSE